MVQRVLLPIDDSERATKALRFAIEQHPDATLTLLHVVNPSDFAAGGFEAGIATNFEQLKDSYEARGKKLLSEAEAEASDAGVAVETALEIGSPARTIVSYADENEVDHIVIGSHGRTGASRILLGSVAEIVVRRAPVPVTVVR